MNKEIITFDDIKVEKDKFHQRKSHISIYDVNINHSHKKKKGGLQGSLDRVLFAAELEIMKILLLGLPQNTSNVNIECAAKPKQLYSFL